MYISNRGTALYVALARHPGTTWGDDLLLNNKDYSSTSRRRCHISMDGPGLHAAIASSRVRLAAKSRREAMDDTTCGRDMLSVNATGEAACSATATPPSTRRSSQ